MNDNIEIRECLHDVELRTNENGEEVIGGYAIVFNRSSEDLGGFIETIEPTAVNSVDFKDTVATFNHNPDQVLGRVPRTMTYKIDERGVHVEITLPDTSVGRDVKELVKRRDVKGMSFTFRLKKDGDRWEAPQGSRKLYKRTITAFDVIPELGPVTFPAYRATDVSVAKRALGLLKDTEEREASEALKIEREKEELRITNYHRAMRLKIKSRLKK